MTAAAAANIKASTNGRLHQMSDEVSLSEPMARAVLDLYATAYSEGQAPDDAQPLLEWIFKHFPRLFEEPEFRWLPKP